MTPRSDPRQVRLTTIAVAIMLGSCLGFETVPGSSVTHFAGGLDFILGTWTGTSTCVGNRPACKNETVVYRVVPVAGNPRQVRLLADKIIDGKRIPMGALVFDVDAASHTARGEFKIGQTHGLWLYTVADDTMTGTLQILPEGTKARDVHVRRTTDKDLPEAPPLSEYDE